MAGRIRIGEILLRAGVIDQHQLNAALGEQRRWGKPIGATLVKMGFVEERSLVRALASQLALPVASLEGKRIAPEVLALVPAELAERHMVLPLFVKQADHRTTLYLAMDDPGDLAVLDDLAFRTGVQVKPVMMASSELAEGIDRYYRDAAARSAQPAAAPASAQTPATAPALDVEPEPSGSTGTEELVRHFRGGGADAPAMPVAAQPASAQAGPSGQSKPGEAPGPPAPTDAAAHGAAQSSFDESALASPPPRERGARGADAPLHPPVESLASYEAKTRTILHVLTQLLIEKGVISREEFHERVSALANVDHAHPRDAD